MVHTSTQKYAVARLALHSATEQLYNRVIGNANYLNKH